MSYNASEYKNLGELLNKIILIYICYELNEFYMGMSHNIM